MHFRLETLRVEDHSRAQKWVKAYYDLEGLDFNDRVSEGIATLLESPLLGQFWEIARNDESVGYIVLTFGFDHEFGGKLGVVTDFYLVEEARGQGLGSQVLQEVIQQAKQLGCRHLELAVLDHNTRADNFYRKLRLKPQTGRRIFEINL